MPLGEGFTEKELNGLWSLDPKNHECLKSPPRGPSVTGLPAPVVGTFLSGIFVSGQNPSLEPNATGVQPVSLMCLWN